MELRGVSFSSFPFSFPLHLINGDGGCSFWQPVQAGSQPKSSGLVLGRRPLGATLHSSNEPGELSQWLTINIVLVIIIYLTFFNLPCPATAATATATTATA